MTKHKTIYLGIVRTQQMYAPTIAELIGNPMYEVDVKAAIADISKANTGRHNQQGQPGQIKKALQRVQQKYRKSVLKEYTFLTDQMNYKDNGAASIIIDVSNRQIVKNRFVEADPQEMIDLYLEKYQAEIQEFIRRFRN